MKITQRVQYGLLMCLYLSRSGTSNLSTIAKNLNISQQFLEQVANLLKKNKIVTSSRGRAGGYTLTPDTTVAQIVSALSNSSMIKPGEYNKFVTGAPEHRALAQHLLDMNSALQAVLNRKIASVMQGLVVNELKSMDKAQESNMEH